MEVNVRFLENLRLEASFDDFTLVTDQPIRYKGDGTAPSPLTNVLSSMCSVFRQGLLQGERYPSRRYQNSQTISWTLRIGTVKFSH